MSEKSSRCALASDNTSYLSASATQLGCRVDGLRTKGQLPNPRCAWCPVD